MLWALLMPLLWAAESTQELSVQKTRSDKTADPGYTVHLPKLVILHETGSVLVPCSFSYPKSSSSSGSVLGYWFRDGANTNRDPPVATNNNTSKLQKTESHFELVGDPKNNNCSLSIRDAHSRDSGLYFFRVDAGRPVRYNYLQNKLCLCVTDLHLQDPETLESNRTNNLTCSVSLDCSPCSTPIFSWVSAALSSLGPRTTKSSVLRLTPQPQDRGSNVTCQVTFSEAGFTMERTIQLNVTYAPRKLTIKASGVHSTEPQLLHSGSSLEVPEGGSLRLVCMADSNPPATLSWEGATPRLVQPSSPEELRLSRVELQDRGDYVCRAQNTLGTQVASVSLRVTSPLQLLGPSCSWEAEGLHCGCFSRAWPTPSLRWWLGEGLLEGNLSNSSFTISSSAMGPWANSSLSLHRDVITSLSLSCKAQNDHGAQSATVLLPRGQDVTKGKPDARMAMVQGGFSGAAIMALLAGGLFVFVVKIYKRTSAEEEDNPDASESDTQRDQPRERVPDLHYASLSFEGLKPRQPQDQEAPKCEYTEIKTHK